MSAAEAGTGLLVRRGVTLALALGIWFTPVPAGLTREAWHLFAIFASAIVSVILAAFPLLTAAMLAVAAVNTTVAALPRAVAWCADSRLWAAAADDRTRPVLVDELLRVLAPVPLLSRVAAAAATVGGCPVRPGDRLALVAKHAADEHRSDPDCVRPAPPHIAQLVFGVGTHACPGARLARAQVADTLRALAPYRPVVRRARADRRSALPGWAALVVTAGGPR